MAKSKFASLHNSKNDSYLISFESFPNKIITLGLILLLSLLGLVSTPNPAAATPDEAKWSRVNIPTEDETGNWVLASGSDVQHLTMAADGTFYCYANPSGTNYTLFKSTDFGYSWSYIGRVKDAIVALATAPDDAKIIYYATASNVYSSGDAGNNFTTLPPNPGGAGSNNIEITSIAVAQLGGKKIIAVGTKDNDSLQYGGVYILDESKPTTSWVNTNIGNYDVLPLAFSPNFSADRQLVAIATNETDTLITTRVHDDWGKVFGDATIQGLVPRTAAIAFPEDYNASTEGYTLFAAIDAGDDKGNVYKVKGIWAPGRSLATDLDIGFAYNLNNVDVSGLSVSGNTTAVSLLAGAANSAQVYISTDSGLKWTRSNKEPTGQSRTCVLMAPDFTISHRAYAATSGTESAFSYTEDGGVTWSQIGLIDTKMSNMVALAMSPDYGQDSSLFLLTFDGDHIEHSLWRSLNGGIKWARVLTSTLATASSIKLVELSPQYGRGSRTVFLAGTSDSNSVIWKSTDNGQTFIRRGAPFPIDIWTVVNDNTLLLCSYDGSNGLVYRTTNSGLSYSDGAAVGNQPLKSIALSPSYETDETLLIGNTNGWVYWSKDNSTSFKRLGQQLPSSTSAGELTVAFDPEFSSNKVIYAASSIKATTASRERIYRFTIGKSEIWEGIDSTLPVGGMLSQLVVSADGALYATNSQPVNATKGEGGMERSLNPTYPLGPTFETVTRGLDDGATLTGLWLVGSQLWSIDTTNTRLMTYTDSLSVPVTLTSPPNKAPGMDSSGISLEWEGIKGATEYRWQLDYDTDFSTIPSGFEGDTEESSARAPALETATTYYWRVRATKPVLSPWSAKWSFTTSLGTAVSAPELYSPEAGANRIPIKPVFQWSAIAGAASYELLVSIDATFSNPIIVKIGDYALPATAWQSDVSLDYNTTYYWKIRAIGSSSHSVWSAVGAFTTEPSPSSPSPTTSPTLSPPPPASPPSTQPTIPHWIIYLTGALFLIVVLLLITLLALVVAMRRS